MTAEQQCLLRPANKQGVMRASARNKVWLVQWAASISRALKHCQHAGTASINRAFKHRQHAGTARINCAFKHRQHAETASINCAFKHAGIKELGQQ